ncbi:MAG: hypothetical protein ACI9CF_001309 [Candidatus Omnitrophota bacterium]|jgi:hypothetical protein
MPRKKINKITLGWVENIKFIDWKIDLVAAKVDTGAATSSLHVSNIKQLNDENVQFYVSTNKGAKLKKVIVTSRISRISKVKTSPLHSECRFFVKTNVCIGGINHEIEINLIDRSSMVYRMLLGRSSLKGMYIVDVSKKYLQNK